MTTKIPTTDMLFTILLFYALKTRHHD